MARKKVMTREKKSKMEKKIQGRFCNLRLVDPIMGCDYFSFDSKDARGACNTFTKGWCDIYRREVDKGQICLGYKK